MWGPISLLPAIVTKSLIVVLPPTNTPPANKHPFPIETLCAMCTWLSNLQKSAIVVSWTEPLSIVHADPISTSLPMITDFIWGILWCVSPDVW